MKKKSLNRNSGLLPLGLVISMAVTLTGFEYISADTKYKTAVTSKMSATEIEMVPDVEVERPDLPSNQQQPQNTNPSVPVVSPPIIMGPIVPVVGPVVPDPGVIIGDPGLPIGGPVFPPEEPIIDDSPFTIVEDMPTFEKFLYIKDKQKRDLETQKEILNIVMSSVEYPEIARQMGIEGKVYVDFVVGKDGQIKDIKIARSVHADLDKEAISGVKNIPSMVPGKQRGEKVSVRYTIPIVFKLDK